MPNIRVHELSIFRMVGNVTIFSIVRNDGIDTS